MNLKQKKTMRIIRKVVSKIFELFLPIIDRVAYINFFNQPFSNLPVSDLKTYEELSKKADENTYSIEDVDLLEKKNNYRQCSKCKINHCLMISNSRDKGLE